MTEQNTQTAPETAPQATPKLWYETPWWIEKYLCNTVDAQDPKPGEPKSIAAIYKAIGIESGRIVGKYVIYDGTLTNESRPLRFFPVESLISSIFETKPGTRVFDSYAAAANYAETVGAKTVEDMMGLTGERLGQIKSDVKGGKTATLKFALETETKA